MVRVLEKQDDIDRRYYDSLVDAAAKDISKYGDLEWFVSDDPYIKKEPDIPPWEDLDPPWDDSPWETNTTAFDVR